MFTVIFRPLLACLLMVLVTLPVQAQTNPPNKSSLTVGVAGGAPFVMGSIENNSLNGISVDLWEDLAKQKDWLFKYQIFAGVDSALTALEEGKLDLVVGPISITSARVKAFQFSQPYYQSSLTIASRNDDLSLWQQMKPFFSLKLLMAIAVFLSILAGVGLLLWLAERKISSQQFPSDPKKGIGNGMWLAIVTMSTTGYGDMAPVTLQGRIIAGGWMIISLIFATSMIAGISSTLTLSKFSSSTITQAEQLPGKKIATVAGSPAERFIGEHQGRKVLVDTLEQAMEKLEAETVDGVIYDQPQLLYYKNQHKAANINIPKAEYYKQGYGFVFNIDSELVSDVNLILLTFAETQHTEEIVSRYLGKP